MILVENVKILKTPSGVNLHVLAYDPGHRKAIREAKADVEKLVDTEEVKSYLSKIGDYEGRTISTDEFKTAYRQVDNGRWSLMLCWADVSPNTMKLGVFTADNGYPLAELATIRYAGQLPETAAKEV